MFTIIVVLITGIQICLGQILDCPSFTENPKIVVAPPVYTSDGFGIEEDGFTITCLAAYPIEWDYDGELGPGIEVSRVHHYEFREFTSSPSSSRTPCYEYTLTFLPISTSSGNYTCTKIGDSSKSDSFYKFYTGSFSGLFKSTSLGHSYKKISLARKSKDNKYLIPCPSNYERINATLVIVQEDPAQSNRKVEVPMKSPDIFYNPKLGFLLDAAAFPNPTGFYKCLGSYGRFTEYRSDFLDIVDIEIERTDATATYYPEESFVHFKNGSLSAEYKIDDSKYPALSLLCESVSAIQFDITRISDTQILNQYTNKPSQEHYKYWATLLLKASGKSKGVVTCQMKDQKKVIASWSFDEGRHCKCLWKRWSGSGNLGHEIVKPYGIYICSMKRDEIRADEQLLPCYNPFECKIITKCLDESNCKIKTFGAFSHIGPFSTQLSFGHVNCSAEDFLKSKMTSREIKRFEKYLLAFQAHTYDLISVTTPKMLVEIGLTHTFICEINLYIMASKIFWGFNMKNGSVVIIGSDDTSGAQSGAEDLHWFIRQHEKSIEITDKNIDSVFCLATIWETGDLTNSSVRIRVHDSYQEVEDPNKMWCSNISETPSIFMRVIDDNVDIPKWYNVTGQVDVVIDGRNPKTMLLCISKDLTEWEFNSETVTDVTNRELIKSNQPNDVPCFSLRLEKLIYDGWYICACTKNLTQRAYLYLFVADPEFQLINHGQHRNLEIDKAENWTIFPCNVNDPSAIVHLIRQDYERNIETLSDFKDPKLESQIQFEPQTGFSVWTDLFISKWNLSDTFICSSVFKGKEDIETNHVITFSISLLDSDDALEVSKPNGTETIRSGTSTIYVVIPWILFGIIIICFLALLKYTISLRQRFSQAKVDMNNGLEVHFNKHDDNHPSSSSTSTTRNPTFMNVDAGITNPTYDVTF